jgi:phospholipid/cholesterol/gamma-HCH transport system substrate-binding protein
MAAGTNRWKLGLFMLLGIAASVGCLIALGAHDWNRASVRYVSYFDESVQGLDQGSPVKFRGVSVGRVAAIDIAPDQRHIAVSCEIDARHLESLEHGTGSKGEKGQTLTLDHPDLRAQLAQAGITGVRFILLDYFEPDAEPPPKLPFPVPAHYIPAAPSLLQNLEHSVVKSTDQFPELVGNAVHVLSNLDAILSEMDRGRLPERSVETLDGMNQLLGALRQQLLALDAPGLSKDFRHTLAALDASLGRADRLMDRFDGADGLVATAQRSFDGIGDIAQGAHSLGGELELTLRDVRGAARSLERFTDALERDPDMLLKGRAARGH